MVTLFGRSAGRPAASVADLRRRRLLHQRRHRRALRDHRAGVSRRRSARPAPASRSASAAAARCWRRSSPGSCSPPAIRCRPSRSRWPPDRSSRAGVLLMLKLGDRPAVPRDGSSDADADRPSPVLPDETKRYAHSHHARRQPDSAAELLERVEGVEGIRAKRSDATTRRCAVPRLMSSRSRSRPASTSSTTASTASRAGPTTSSTA